jgi:Radical SAM superfamily
MRAAVLGLEDEWLMSGPYYGCTDAISERHVAGWVHNPGDAAERVTIEVVLAATGEVLTRGKAANHIPGLRRMGLGDGEYGFHILLPRRLTAAEREDIIVRPVSATQPLVRSGLLVTAYEPVQHVIMDIVDNCNLRCPFCVYDYALTRRTHMMSETTFRAAARLAPFVTEGNFWFSCLHEPALHPDLTAFIEAVPQAYRSKLFYTTNLAKRMPAAYFRMLASSGMHHINISIESLDPAVYEAMRKGARFHIFKENWDQVVLAFRQGAAPPALRYISLAFRSTFRQLPPLIPYLLHERRGSVVEIRHAYDAPHIPNAFRQAEYLRRDDWLWLRDQLAGYTRDQVVLALPPGLDDPEFDEQTAARGDHLSTLYESNRPAPPAWDLPVPAPFRAPLPKGYLAGQYGFRLYWNGRLEINAIWGDQEQPAPPELRLLTANIGDIDDLDALFGSLPS